MASGVAVNTVTHAYDAAGQLTGLADASAALTFSYDGAGRPSSAATSSAGGQPAVTLTSGYDAAGRRTGLVDTLPSAGATQFTYDAAGRMRAVAASYGGAVGPVVTLGHAAAGRLTSLARTAAGSAAEVDSAFAYDAADRLTTIAHGVAGGAALAAFAYGYDAANRTTSETNAEGTASYTYDATDQLAGAAGSRSESYTYDANGNRAMSGYSTGANNELSSGAGYTYAYDAEGNLASKTEASTGRVWTYAWDYRDRLAGAVQRTSGGAELVRATYTYDALDRRVGVDETVSGVETRTWTAYDGANAYADFDGSGALEQRYLDGPAADFLLARTSAAGATAWYLTDKLGTVRDVVGESGTVLDHVAYDSYGNVSGETDAAAGDRFKYTGRELSTATGLQYNRARYYDAAIGRWISPDPWGFGAGDANLDRYVGNGPTNGVDPTGLFGDRPAVKMGRTRDDGPTVDRNIGDGPANATDPGWLWAARQGMINVGEAALYFAPGGFAYAWIDPELPDRANQTALESVNGVTDTAIDLLNLAGQLYDYNNRPGANQLLTVNPYPREGDLTLPAPRIDREAYDFSHDVHYARSRAEHDATKFLGGALLLEAITAGLGGLSKPVSSVGRIEEAAGGLLPVARPTLSPAAESAAEVASSIGTKAPKGGRTLESFRPEAEAIVAARRGPSRILVMEDPGVRGTLNPAQDNIVFRELELSRRGINQTQPFNQALSDTGGQPIRVVVTQNGEKHIMQGNHRIYGAREQGLQSAEALIYTPEQWEVLTESPFVPRGTNNPAIKP